MMDDDDSSSINLVVARAGQRAAAEAAIRSIGLGYDITLDLRLNCCRRSSDLDPRLVVVALPDSDSDSDSDYHNHLHIPGCAISIPRVPKSIKCDKGELIRFSSDLLSFQQMSELFNQGLSVSGKIPTGHFNSAFDFTGIWQRDAAETKGLAFDRVSIELYNIALDKSILLLRDHVKQAVPTSWDPAALARFIQNFGTHIIVGVKMGGEHAIYVKQTHSSPLSPNDLQRNIKDAADKIFIDGSGHSWDPHESCDWDKDIQFISKRKGGSSDKKLCHSEWCQTVQFEPDVISMSLVPIASLLSGIYGSGFLSHAMNLYARYKPPSEELRHFLDFQLPRIWAPVYGELPLGPKLQSDAYLQFSFLGSKLYVNTTRVDAGNKAVTGIRLYLEGKRKNILAIHLQHLSKLPMSFQLEDDVSDANVSELYTNHRYHEKVRWKCFSHVCTAAVEANNDLSIVTGAHFEVGHAGLNKVLYLRLHFSKVTSAMALREIKWDICPALTGESGIIATLISTHFSTATKPPPKPADVCINSAVYPGGPPVPTETPKLEKYVDTTEITRGPQDTPGYWVVSGARLVVGKGKIALMVKYSLLDVMYPDEEDVFEYNY